MGIIDAMGASLLQAQYPDVHAGDVVMTPWCAEQYGEDLRNEVYFLTR